MRYFFIILPLILLLSPTMAAAGENSTVAPIFEGFYLTAKASGFLQPAKSSKLEVGPSAYSFPDKNALGFGGGLACGYDFDKQYSVPIRLEVEYFLRSKKQYRWTGDRGIFIPGPVDWEVKAHSKVDTLLFNAYYDFFKNKSISPYISAGFGVAFTKTTASYKDNIGTPPMLETDKEKKRVWALGCGAAYAINDNWSMDLGYRYIDVGTVSVKYSIVTVSSKIALHETTFGIRYTF